MAKFVEVDVRGLSCPEPVLLTMDAMEEHPGEMIRVLGDEAHTRKNIEKMLEYEHKDGQTTTRADGCFEITFQAYRQRMRAKKPYQVLTFYTTSAVMELETFCKQNEIPGRLIPVPRELSAGCGIAWRMEPDAYRQHSGLLAECPVEIEQTKEVLL